MKFGRLLANIIHRWGRAGHKYVLLWADLRHVPIPAGSILTVSVPAVSRRVDAPVATVPMSAVLSLSLAGRNSLVHIYPALLGGSGAVISTGVIRGFSNVFL